MPETIFYSWQADQDKTTGRNFIERALDRALGKLNEEVHLEEAQRELLELDRDTKDVAGQPPVVETIFRKIDAASAFVPDLTFVAKREDGRPSPNPNVLIEYGWALRSLTHSRIVAVMNTAYGEPTDQTMPFDMKHLRFPITYHLEVNANDEEKRRERERLSTSLADAIANVLKLQKPKLSATKSFAPHEEVSPGRFRHPGVPIGISDRMSMFDEASPEVFLSDGGAVWLRVMPELSQDKRWRVSELKQAGWGNGFLLSPILSPNSMSELRADDGYGVCSSIRDHHTENVSFAFETGEVWGIDSYLIPRTRQYSNEREKAGFPIFEANLVGALQRYVQFLHAIGVVGPFRWIAGLAQAKGLGLYYRPPPGKSFVHPGPFGTCVAEVISESGPVLAGDQLSKSLLPFFDKVFEKFGLERPDYLNGADA